MFVFIIRKKNHFAKTVQMRKHKHYIFFGFFVGSDVYTGFIDFDVAWHININKKRHGMSHQLCPQTCQIHSESTNLVLGHYSKLIHTSKTFVMCVKTWIKPKIQITCKGYVFLPFRNPKQYDIQKSFFSCVSMTGNRWIKQKILTQDGKYYTRYLFSYFSFLSPCLLNSNPLISSVNVCIGVQMEHQ